MAAQLEPQVEPIKPQAMQEVLLKSAADIAVYGGAAGAGKSFALLLEPIYHINNSKFGGVIFRRSFPEVKRPGGLWDEAGTLYPLLGAKPNNSDYYWTFPTGSKIMFSHMQDEKTKYAWQGAQVPFFGFDELTHYTETMFFYMLSRNRSTCGVKPYVRATTNPDADSWVAQFISWWIGEDGFAIPERAGKIRWFVRISEELVWADSRQQLIDKYAKGALQNLEPKSVTFIPARIWDNPKLLDKDPTYLANLMAQPLVERERLLNGNWKIRPAAGTVFKLEWMSNRYNDLALPTMVSIVQSVDASFKTGVANDYSVIATWGTDGVNFYLLDIWRNKVEYTELKHAILDQYNKWRPNAILIEDAAAGVSAIQELRRETSLAIIPYSPVGSKTIRAETISPLFEANKIRLPQSREWLADWINEHAYFPEAAKDDQVDSTSSALNWLQQRPIISIVSSATGEVVSNNQENEADLILKMLNENELMQPATPNNSRDYLVETSNPQFLLDSMLNSHFNAVLVQDEKGNYIKQEGAYIMRVLSTGNPDYVAFAINNQGYGKVIRQL